MKKKVVLFLKNSEQKKLNSDFLIYSNRKQLFFLYFGSNK